MEIKDMNQEDAEKRIKELNKEIRKHEVFFLFFIFISVLDIILTATKVIPFNVVTVIVVLGSILSSYGIYKYSEPYELEKYLIELIFGKKK